MNFYNYQVAGKYVNIPSDCFLILNEKQFNRRKLKLEVVSTGITETGEEKYKVKISNAKKNKFVYKVFQCKGVGLNTFKKGETFLIDKHMALEVAQGKIIDLDPASTVKLHPPEKRKPSKFVKGGLGEHLQKLKAETLKAETEEQKEVAQGKIEIPGSDLESTSGNEDNNNENADDTTIKEGDGQEKKPENKPVKELPKPIYFVKGKGKK